MHLRRTCLYCCTCLSLCLKYNYLESLYPFIQPENFQPLCCHLLESEVWGHYQEHFFEILFHKLYGVLFLIVYIYIYYVTFIM